MSFNITITSKSSDPVSIAIFINPRKIIRKPHTLLSDLFPQAWKTYNFSGGNAQMSVFDSFSPIYRAYVDGATIHNDVSCSSSHLVSEDCKSFDLKSTSSGAVKMVLSTSTQTEKADLTITNSTGESQRVGVADQNGVPYFTIEATDKSTSEFVCLIELAVVVVSNSKPGKLFKSDTVFPFVSFLANDVHARSIHIVFDGSRFDIEGVTFHDHTQDSKMFSM